MPTPRIIVHPRRIGPAHPAPSGTPKRAPALVLTLALGLALALSGAGPSSALAAGGGGDDHGGSAAESGDRPDKETLPPRTMAQDIGGAYMQLNALWLPIFKGSRSRYQAMTARLVPHPDKRVLACFKGPWAQEALLFELNETPLTVDDLDTLGAMRLKQRLLDRVHAHIGARDVYIDIELLSGLEDPAPTEQTLSLMCR